jgi:glycerol-3-phosphate dehydrogenase (NAD(P)+)
MTSESRNRALVIGYGEMGHAMEFLLGERHELDFHDIRPMERHEQVDPETAAARADFVIYCVPAVPLAELARRLLPVLSDHSISLSIAKGLDEEGRPAAGIFRDVYAGRRDYGVIYGPMISEEIRAGKPAFGQVGVSRAGAYAQVAGLFAGSGLTLEQSTDVIGISWAAVLKNVYAILFGAADELALGDNVRGCLTVQAQVEMAGMIERLGGHGGTARELAGLGDLVTTATSAGSHHHDLGRRLARGELQGLSGEGIHTLSMLRRYSLIDTADYPLFRLAQQLIETPGDVVARMLVVLRRGGV